VAAQLDHVDHVLLAAGLDGPQRQLELLREKESGYELAFTRYSFSSKLLCTGEPSLSCPSLSALPTLLQYYCATFAVNPSMPPPTLPLCAIHHTILVMG